MFVWDISQARFHFSKSDWLVISESENRFENNSKLINFGEWMTCQFQNRWQRARWYLEMFSQSSLVDFSGWFRSVALPSRLWIFYPIWCLMEWFSKRSMKRNPVLPGGFWPVARYSERTNFINWLWYSFGSCKPGSGKTEEVWKWKEGGWTRCGRANRFNLLTFGYWLAKGPCST